MSKDNNATFQGNIFEPEQKHKANGCISMNRVGVDVGGTFTDFIMMDDKGGSIFTNKVSSTPSDTSIGNG